MYTMLNNRVTYIRHIGSLWIELWYMPPLDLVLVTGRLLSICKRHADWLQKTQSLQYTVENLVSVNASPFSSILQDDFKNVSYYVLKWFQCKLIQVLWDKLKFARYKNIRLNYLKVVMLTCLEVAYWLSDKLI